MDVRFGWTYRSTVGIGSSSPVEERLRDYWDKAFIDTNACAIDECNDIQITATQKSSSASSGAGDVQVSFIIANAPLVQEGHSNF